MMASKVSAVPAVREFLFDLQQSLACLLYTSLYKSAYCGLCKRMGKDYGRLSRLALSYDGTFLAMLSMALRDDCPGFEAGRCVANPAKRCTYCTGHEESYAYAGAVSVLTCLLYTSRCV